MFRHLSIHKRLAFVLWGSVLLAFVAAGAGLLLYQALTLESRARQIMEPYAQMVAVGTDAAVAFADPLRAQEILDTLRANPQILAAEITLDDGRSLASFSNVLDARAQQQSEKPDGIYLGSDAAQLLQGLPKGGRLRISMSLAQLSAQTHQAMWMFGAGMLVLLAATLIQMAVLRRTIVRPIASLTETTELVRARADYTHRIPVSGDGELARLGQSFNAMLEGIQQREDDLRRLAAFQRTILANAAYSIISVTPEGIVTSFNPAAERLLGYTADEVAGKQTPALWHDPHEMAQHARVLSSELGETIAPGFEVFAARPRRGLTEEREWIFTRKDGTRVPANLSVTALRDEGGNITGFVGLIYDLTERKQVEAEIHQLNQELEQRVAERTAQLTEANKELEAFAYSVSHDLRSPLRHIDGFLGLLKEQLAATLDAQSQHYMDTISKSVKRMGELIDDLLSFSRMGRQEMTRGPVDLGALVEDVIHEFEPETKGRVIHWHIGELPVVVGDYAMLRVVLANLVSNALKFTQTREQTAIEIGCLPDTSGHENETVVFVRDNGVGFDMRYANKLFGVFERLHSGKDFEGTGIGLANVHRVVSRNGGTTWAEGKVNGGATFFFSLPRENPSVARIAPSKATASQPCPLSEGLVAQVGSETE
ncbi:MAG: PAS domain S-box protein [Thiobacillus sp.]|nr:PAS domain S-box protein [Thiobacillus sp.]